MTRHIDHRTEQELADRLARKVVSNLEWPCKLVQSSFDTEVSNELYKVIVTVEPKEEHHGQTTEH